MKLFLLLSLLIITLNVTLAQSNPHTSNKGNSGLINETMLHPGDAFTGEVLEKNTLLIGWSLLPPDILPGWIIYGVTNRLTIETDILNWLGAVPNLNVRFALLRPKHGNISVAYETMFIYLPKRIDIVLPKDLSFSLEGIDWYHRMSLTWIGAGKCCGTITTASAWGRPGVQFPANDPAILIACYRTASGSCRSGATGRAV